MAAAVAPAARKRPAPDEAGSPADAGKKKRARYQFENIDDYEMLEEIGEGIFGVVAKARDRRTGAMVAVKWIRGGEFGENGTPNLPAVVREAGCLAACRGHPGIVQIKNVAKSEETGDLYIVMELAGPSLRSRLERRRQPFSEDETRDAMRQLLRAAEKLHATGTIHRDINPDNILVGADGALKICGFGCAMPARGVAGKTLLERLVEGATVQRQEKLDGTTMQYRSPEQLIWSRWYGPEGDIYALGCVMAELLTGGEPLFTATTEDDMIEQTLDLRDDIVTMGVEAFDDVMDHLSLAGREVLAGLLSYDSWERPTAADALKHRWFTEETKPPAAVEPEFPGFVVPLFTETGDK
ncbi:putative cyclin-dependent kinase F-2 [Panicum virgatum]|uniref:Protein kinase domain-containing protein n=1 Tax=Panicum virgatum TaxID=38727 RepID=A0A8T0V1H4_PANVG|nr:putative cyclin-dependent kinase F-2 [Panicum virgatum]KAG2627336.1 hypothetical protein PVAP13_3KG124484 [Panicum virgatum]